MIRKLWLIPKFMTSQAGQQTIAIRILPNISRSKGNQAMKFGQLIKYSTRNIFLENHAEKELGRQVQGISWFFKKVLFKVEASGQHLSFKIFW